jgi:hypothetical protein
VSRKSRKNRLVSTAYQAGGPVLAKEARRLLRPVELVGTGYVSPEGTRDAIVAEKPHVVDVPVMGAIHLLAAINRGELVFQNWTRLSAPDKREWLCFSNLEDAIKARLLVDG